MAYVQAISDLLSVIRPLAQPVEDSLKPCWWIITHEGDRSFEYCGDCVDKEVDRLRAKYPDVPESDIYADGGFAIDHDSHVFCETCGIRLIGNITTEGVREEIAHYSREGFHCFDAEVAFDVEAILANAEYVSDKSPPDIEPVLELGRKFIAGKQYYEIVQPSTWADDGGPVIGE